MSDYAVITQNDKSDWNDIKGSQYHFPKTYQSILTPGCKVIYYKGRQKDKKFTATRLDKEPHYFGCGVIGESVPDHASDKNDYYCDILDYREFEKAVLSKQGENYLETIPESRLSNYWRFGVREISEDNYHGILNEASLLEPLIHLPSVTGDYESFSTEGGTKYRYSTYYERNIRNRQRAIDIHGLSCQVCQFNFEERYGELGIGFIHVHHLKPLSTTGETEVDPRTDLSVLCPNCHAMVHRPKNHTLSLDELRALIDS